MIVENRLADDLNEIMERSDKPLRTLVNSHVLVTGGTGFVGTWFVEALLWARSNFGGIGRVSVVSRDPAKFLTRNPHLVDNAALRFVVEDIRALDLSALPDPDFVLHAATPASAAFNDGDPAEMLDVIVGGQNRLFGELARFARPRVLFTSSGAVYGPQPEGLSHFPEDYLSAQSDRDERSAYHEGKRAAELICLDATSSGVADVVLARLFAFVGPHLPIDTHFAIGNFIRDAMGGGPIVLNGDGTTVRSYQYASDMTSWLLALLVDGAPGRAYNVGSDRAMNMREIATSVARVAGPDVRVEVRGTQQPGQPVDRYVPSVERAISELGLENRIDFDEAVSRTLKWHRP